MPVETFDTKLYSVSWSKSVITKYFDKLCYTRVNSVEALNKTMVLEENPIKFSVDPITNKENKAEGYDFSCTGEVTVGDVRICMVDIYYIITNASQMYITEVTCDFNV